MAHIKLTNKDYSNEDRPMARKFMDESFLQGIGNQIDKALDDRLFETNPESFKELIDKYNTTKMNIFNKDYEVEYGELYEKRYGKGNYEH